MQGYNLIAVLNQDGSRILMCKRRKEPYKGLLNLVGGKIELGEGSDTAAYRELAEETGITGDDISLTHLLDFTYHLDACYVEVYVGQLRQKVAVHGEENDLLWVDWRQDMFDMRTYAGEGNIGHIFEHIKLSSGKLQLKGI